MGATETFTQRRRHDLELLVRGVQAALPGGRHDDLEAAVGIAATRQGLSKGNAVETYRRLVAEDRARFVGQNDRRVEMKLLGLAIAALDRYPTPDEARAMADAGASSQDLSRTRFEARLRQGAGRPPSGSRATRPRRAEGGCGHDRRSSPPTTNAA